jgi:hypothetical protein
MIEVILFRLFFAVFVIPFPLFGGLLSATAEFIDLNILMMVEPEAFPVYQYLDKTLDLLYLGLEAYIASTWKNKLVRNTVLVLFFIRFIGTILFYVIKDPIILVIFPNVFEWFFLTALILMKLNKDQFLTKKSNIFDTVGILLFVKLVHEYYLHVFLPLKIHPPIIQKVIEYFSRTISF